MFLDHTVYNFNFVTKEESVAIYFCQFYILSDRETNSFFVFFLMSLQIMQIMTFYMYSSKSTCV